MEEEEESERAFILCFSIAFPFLPFPGRRFYLDAITEWVDELVRGKESMGGRVISGIKN